MIFLGKARLGLLEQVGDHVIPLEDRFRLGGITTLRGYNYSEVGGPYGNLERSVNSFYTQAYDNSGEPIFDSNGNPIRIQIDRRTLGLGDDQMAELRSGGMMERLFNFELLFPLAGDNIRGVVFYDAGNVNSEQIQYEILGEEDPGFFDLRQSVGFGVRMITPLGVFRFEYGKKLAPRPGETSDRFDFTISSLF